jgi:chaperonin GroEL (HSP60 family)
VFEYELCFCSFKEYLFFIFVSSITTIGLFYRFKNEEVRNTVATVVLRGSTDSILDDLERAVDDGVNTYKVFL